jgi:hypothetical protein
MLMVIPPEGRICNSGHRQSMRNCNENIKDNERRASNTRKREILRLACPEAAIKQFLQQGSLA